MKNKRTIRSILNFKSILISIALILIIGTAANAKSRKWSPDGGQWFDGIGNVYYILGDTLTVSEVAPHSMN